jgi:UDP-2-acetamido-3-amino-2,3-dideoxy-glucuronate N-acetyltransferase
VSGLPLETRRSSPDPDLLLVGAGDWGRNLARCFATLGALASVVVASEAEADALRGKLGAARLTSSFREALADPAIRKVAIATPSASHFELARAALEAGKDVFVEKPLCLRAEHAQALVELAEGAGLTLMVGHLLQYHPCVAELRALVRDGVLGRLLTITSNRLNLGKFRADENALYSFAPHDVSLVLSLLSDGLPESVRCVGGSFVKPGVADSTTTSLRFAGGTMVQLYVSWLNPFKEQKLTVVGSDGMAVFDDTKPWREKLVLYRDYMSRSGGKHGPGAEVRAEPRAVPEEEPLLAECRHFLECCAARTTPRTDGREGVRVLKVLDMAQRSLALDGERVVSAEVPSPRDYFVHPSALVDDGARIGAGSKIWHFCHVSAGAHLGQGVMLGQNVFVADGVTVADGCRVQNNVSLYSGVELERDVFVGPSAVFTNVKEPRAEYGRNGCFERTLVRRGASIGANATVVCGTTLGRYCLVGAGAVVTRDVPDYAVVVGNPARQAGWLSRHGAALGDADHDGVMICARSGLRYREQAPGKLACLDDAEDTPGAEETCSSTI